MPDVVIHPQPPDPIARIHQGLAPLWRSLLRHGIYEKLTSVHALQALTEHHCFAVWDFMSLLKTLQRRLTCVRVPWTPPREGEAAHLINEIVIAEESAVDPDRVRHRSHFELYLDAMAEIEADTGLIDTFLGYLAGGMSWRRALLETPIDQPVRSFVERTLNLCEQGKIWEIAAEFVFGREDLVPDMFARLAKTLPFKHASSASLTLYLDHHLGSEPNERGRAGEDLLRSLCGDATNRWAAVEWIAHRAIDSRIALWDSVVARIDNLAVLA